MIKNCAVLTIAGSDSGGGAGIQADIKTFSALGVFGTCVITAVTAQSLSGVYAIQPIDPDVIRKQLIAVLDGFPIKAIKTGMLYSSEIIEIIADTLGKPEYRCIPIVIDPVFVSTSGKKLIWDDAIEKLTSILFPLASLVTPNIPELESLLGDAIDNKDSLELAAHKFYKRFGVPVLAKGGHLTDKAIDVFLDSEGMNIFESPIIGGVNTHGSGCTLSSAIAAALARGESLKKAVETAKEFITLALKNSLRLSPDINIINHNFSI